MSVNNILTQAQFSQIKHTDEYICYKVANAYYRNVFYNVQYSEYEEAMIEKMQETLEKSKITLPQDWEKEMTLKYVYSGEFNIDKARDNLKQYLEWKQNKDFHTLTPEAEELLKKGVVYCLGRDKQFRPLIFIQAALISTKITDLPMTLNALCVLLSYVQKHMLIPYYVEKWRIIVDFSNLSLLSIPIQIVKQIIDVTQINYTQTVEQMYILNLPFLFRVSAPLVEKLIHPETAKKIKIISDSSNLFEKIDKDQLQLRHGGTMPNLSLFWFILIVYFRPITIPFSKQGESIYMSMMDSQYFSYHDQHEPELATLQQSQECCINCNIF